MIRWETFGLVLAGFMIGACLAMVIMYSALRDAQVIEVCVQDHTTRICKPYGSPIPHVELDDGGYLQPRGGR